MDASPAIAARTDLLGSLLRDVSRSFYLTLRVLPRPVRAQVGLAYLLARTSDTVADTEALPAEDRLAALNALRQRVLGLGEEKVDFGRFLQSQASPAERALLERAEQAAALLDGLSAADRSLLREVLSVILSGQELDLRRFGRRAGDEILSLRLEAELEDYTHRVAGCVGLFWTKICLAHLPVPEGLDRGPLLEQGVRFGKGLQLVNILRDLPVDLRAGRCYLPQERLQALGLTPRDLLDPAAEAKLRPLFNEYLWVAKNHLDAGWHYTNALPRDWMRVRLACAWPVLIGARTLARLRKEPILNPNRRVKITRSEVRSIMLGSLLRHPFPGAWNRQFSRDT